MIYQTKEFLWPYLRIVSNSCITVFVQSKPVHSSLLLSWDMTDRTYALLLPNREDDMRK